MVFRSGRSSSSSGTTLGVDANGQPTLIGIAFGLFAAAMMFAADAMIAYYAVLQLWTLTYKTTSGTVLSNEIDRISGKGGCSFVLNVTYSYQLGNVEYLGHAIRYGPSTSFRTEARAAAAFPVGTLVVVYYNPRHLSDAVLLRGLQKADLMWGLFLLPFNLFFGLAGLGTILYLVIPTKWASKWNSVPTGIRTFDDGIVATLQYYWIPPWAAAIAASGPAAFVMFFAVEIADDALDPTTSFAIYAWCGVLVAAAIVYWKVRQSPNLLTIDRNAGQVILVQRGQLMKSFAMADVAETTLEEIDFDQDCKGTSCAPGVSFNTIAVLRDQGQGEERFVLHAHATLTNALWMVKWMRERLTAS